MPLVLIALATIAVVAAVTAARVMLARRRARRDRAARARRLAAHYPVCALEGGSVPLKGDAGRIAVRPDGLYVSLGEAAGPFHHVPWESTRPAVAGGSGSGEIVVGISKVGDVAVPGSLGRQIWSHTVTRAGGGDDAPERARAARV